MPEHFFEKSEDGEEAPMAKVWREFHSHEERRRWRWKAIWNHQTVGIPTIVFLLLIGAAGVLMLSHFFGRPWF